MVRQDIQGWMKHVDIGELRKYLDNKKVFIWGAFIQGKYVKDFLEENDIHIEGFCDSYRAGIYEEKKVYQFEEVKKVQDIFVLVAINDVRKEIIAELIQAGLEAEKDYKYIFHKYIVTPYIQFRDDFGNEIYVDSYLPNLKVEVNGYGSRIHIGKNVSVEDGTLTIRLGSNSRIEVGNGCTFNGNNSISVVNESTITLGTKCALGDSDILSYDSISVGNGSNLGECTIVANIKSPIRIGNDCLFSSNIHVRSGDGHTIFDLNKKTSLLEEKERFVNIGDHVWIGSSATIIHNADIGNGCAIGTGSLVNKKFKNNCLIAGSPARIIRDSIVWEDEDGLEWGDYLQREL